MSMPQWQGLLNWSLKQTPEENKPPRKPLSPEDVAFLEGAMKSVQEHDQLVNNAIEAVKNVPKQGASDPKLLEHFEILADYYIEHPGNASNLHKNGLLDALVQMLSMDIDPEILEAALSLLSCTLSNNETVLKAAAEKRLTATLLRLATRTCSGTSLQLKLLSALACSIRHCEVAERDFIVLGGLNFLVTIMSNASSDRIRERSALLFYHFIILKKAPENAISSIDLLGLIKSLLPLDHRARGLSYCEVCARLFHALVVNYESSIPPDVFEALKGILLGEISRLALDPETSDCVDSLNKCINKTSIC